VAVRGSPRNGSLLSGVALVGEVAAEIYGVDGSDVEIQEAAFHIDESIARYAMVFQQRLRDRNRSPSSS